MPAIKDEKVFLASYTTKQEPPSLLNPVYRSPDRVWSFSTALHNPSLVSLSVMFEPVLATLGTTFDEPLLVNGQHTSPSSSLYSS